MSRVVPDLGTEPENAEWLRTKWTVPPYRSKEFGEWMNERGITLEVFQTWPMYNNALRSGLIKEERWTGKEVKWYRTGLRPGVKFEEQVERRIADALGEVASLVKERSESLRRQLRRDEVGAIVIETASQYNDEPVLPRLTFAKPDTNGLKNVSKVNNKDHEAALGTVGWILIKAMSKEEFPPLHYANVREPEYLPERRLILTPTKSDLSTLRWAVQLYVDTLGKNMDAAKLVRRQMALPHQPRRITPAIMAYPGPWIDWYDGAVKETSYDKEATLLTASIAKRTVPTRKYEIGLAYELAPNQVGLYMAMVRGQFIEVDNGQ